MPERHYTAPYLGVIDENTYTLLGGVIESGLIRGLETRVNFVRGEQDTVGLTDLAGTIEKEFELEEFVRSPLAILEKYGKHYRNTWPLLKSAANSLICEQYLQSSGQLGSRIISGVALETIVQRHIAHRFKFLGIRNLNPILSVESAKKGGCVNLAFPDNFITRQTEPQKAEVDYAVHRIFMEPFEATTYLNRLRATLQEPNGRQALQLALNYMLFNGLGYSQHISLPQPDQLKPTLVASFSSQKDSDFLQKHFSETLCVGIPRSTNINRIALFFLRVKTVMIPIQENWQDYFAAVEPAPLPHLPLADKHDIAWHNVV